MKPNARLAVMCAALYIATHAITAAAQQSGGAAMYPAKPIRLIVPQSPGGTSDILARTVAQKLSETMKQTVFVDNRPGAAATIGTNIAAKSAPDGYTMLLVGMGYVVNASLYPKLPYDILKDLTAVTMLAAAPFMLAAHPSLPVKSLKQLIALAKSRPGELSYASGGSGITMVMELLKLQAGINIVYIPYKGTAPALNDLVAGYVQLQILSIISGLPLVKAARIRALAVSTAKRSSVAPEIPTIAESGVPGFDESGQYGILVPAGTPPEIVARLHQEIVKVLQLRDVKNRFASEGAEIVGNAPERYNAIIRSDAEKWPKVIKQSGIRAN